MSRIKRVKVVFPDTEEYFWSADLDEDQADEVDEVLSNIGIAESVCIPCCDGTSRVFTKAMIDRAVFIIHFTE